MARAKGARPMRVATGASRRVGNSRSRAKGRLERESSTSAARLESHRQACHSAALATGYKGDVMVRRLPPRRQ